MKFYYFILFIVFLQFYQNDVALSQQSPTLSCLDFDNTCAWHNCQTPPAPLMWFRSTANISTDQIMMTTGTNVVPNGSYAIVATNITQQRLFNIQLLEAWTCKHHNFGFNKSVSSFAIIDNIKYNNGSIANATISAVNTTTSTNSTPNLAGTMNGTLATVSNNQSTLNSTGNTSPQQIGSSTSSAPITSSSSTG
uniref:Uncharacterized protein n=1 Tax=Globodera rostochiensis TaxID=31243 RepID=A0A914IFC2_GLORO